VAGRTIQVQGWTGWRFPGLDADDLLEPGDGAGRGRDALLGARKDGQRRG
jgi:hypothetical protein